MSEPDVKWIETTHEVYAAIFRQHIGDFVVFGTISRPDDSWEGERRMMTEWGFKGADAPIIKRDERGDPPVHQYFIACVKESP